MSQVRDIPVQEAETKRRNALADFFIRLWGEKPLGTISGIIILILIFVAIFADVLAPYGYREMHLADRFQGASAQYLLGTDQFGRDFLSRIIYGARYFVNCRSGRDRSQCCRRCPDRRHFRIPWW